jgi:hypothetical protein
MDPILQSNTRNVANVSALSQTGQVDAASDATMDQMINQGAQQLFSMLFSMIMSQSGEG